VSRLSSFVLIKTINKIVVSFPSKSPIILDMNSPVIIRATGGGVTYFSIAEYVTIKKYHNLKNW